ncbi:MAG: substrate-binding domain-containing protein [Clostridiales bacterium]|nr:substrate-binding domain-containing protein [Clostridiales bacterium]
MSRDNTLYLRVYRDLLRQIREGVYADGKKLPTESELMQRYSVARITARNAMQKLEDEGYIERFPRRGSFVRKNLPAENERTNPPVVILIMGTYAHNFGYEVMSGMLEKCAEYGYHLIVKESGNSQKKEEQIFRELEQIEYAGLLVQPATGETYNPWLVSAVYAGKPLVLFDRMLPGIRAPYVGTNNAGLSEQAVAKLLEKGHEQIALITLTGEQTSSIRERIQGFVSACSRFGVPIHKDLWLDNLQGKRTAHVSEEAITEQCAKKIAAHLKRHPQITAIYGTESLMTVAAVRAVHRLNLNIPGDISIVGFDLPATDLNISHVEQNQLQIGIRAVERLHRLIHGEDRTPSSMRIPGVWVEGDSVLDLKHPG